MPPALRQPVSPASKPPLRATALAAALLLTALPGWSQQAPAPEKLEKVEVTGSAIKRLETEGALPIQVIRREDIVKAGVTTAAELMATITGASNNLGDGASVAPGQMRDQVGFNSANLRGLGTSSTLVLLNGRRMANFASPGDDAGVDLNNIPAAAIQRVEVLLDGASAIYGTDAIGGVINFITRKDYQGVQADVYAGYTPEGGAGKRTASISAGFGDLAKDRFNVFGVVDFQRTNALNTSQRKFISELKIPERLPHLLSSAGLPGNIIRLSSRQRDILDKAGFLVNGKPLGGSSSFNLSVPTCSPPHTLYLPDGIGGEHGCTFDYMRDLELYPKTEKSGALTRGVFQVANDHQLFAEASFTRSKSYYAGTSNRIDGKLDAANIPGLASYFTGVTDPGDRLLTVRARLLDAGNRVSELTSTGSRVVLGMNGTLGAWDYDWAFNHSVNRVADRAVHGYLLYDEAQDGFTNGLINPFGPSTAAQRAFLDSIQVNDEVRSARGTMDSFDIKGSRSLAKLAGGDLAIAVGGELRREKATSRASDLLASNNILGDDAPGDAQTTNNSRKVWAVYSEINAPITQQLEVQAALRMDHYDKIGSTTNPKIGLRYTPTKNVLLRASAGTGFRAPSLNDLYRPVKTGSTATLPDPVCMAENNNDLASCADLFDTRTYSNPNLKPERSRQFSMGLLVEPTAQWSLGLDYWNIQKRNLISTLGDDVILGNLAKYGSLVHRYSDVMPVGSPQADLCEYDPDDTSICYIELHKENRGRQKASGLDFTLIWRGEPTRLGRFGAKLVGTLTLSSKEQTGNGDPFISNLGRFVTDGVVQRWRHRLNLDWSQGDWSLNLANTFYSGYTDHNTAIDSFSGKMVEPNKVKAYSLWDLSGAWTATRSLTLRAGVKNLANTSPPFSNQANFFISGYDPTYTDPRGRFIYVSAQYQFR